MLKRRIPAWEFYECVGISSTTFWVMVKYIRQRNNLKAKHQPLFIGDL